MPGAPRNNLGKEKVERKGKRQGGGWERQRVIDEVNVANSW